MNADLKVKFLWPEESIIDAMKYIADCCQNDSKGFLQRICSTMNSGNVEVGHLSPLVASWFRCAILSEAKKVLDIQLRAEMLQFARQFDLRLV
jgi:hypothetical protein